MGQSASVQEIDWTLVTSIKRSDKYHGYGVFAKQDIPKGVHFRKPIPVHQIKLNETTSMSSDSIGGVLNDANMIYPNDFSEKSLLTTFKDYLERDICNVEQLEDSVYIVIRDIKKGDECTKTYGLCKWGGMIASDNPQHFIPIRNALAQVGYVLTHSENK